jgi:branched-chain amino acid transport system permease protein
MLAQQIINGLVTGSVYALFALGFTLVFGVMNVLNLAHGAVFMWGAFVGLYGVTTLGLPLPATVVVAALAAGLLAVLLDRLAFRPLRRRGASEFSAIISSIGAGFILVNVAQRVSETQILRYPFGTFPVQVIRAFGVRITLLQITIVVTSLLLLGLLMLYLHRTPFGQRIRAVAIDERAAGLLGVDPDRVYVQVFFISGALAGVAGVLIGLAFNSVHFLMGEPYMLRAFVVVVLGGLGSVVGAVVAGLALGVLQTLTNAYLSSGLSDAIIFSVLFLVLLLKPTGFFGTLQQQRRVARE